MNEISSTSLLRGHNFEKRFCFVSRSAVVSARCSWIEQGRLRSSYGPQQPIQVIPVVLRTADPIIAKQVTRGNQS
ncbi:unnamed protein product [Coffea canephora]|uniref:Uncharacterized protein n=1 Tax=Coffea canephora TaxID=49390 RepID=A0A068TNU4_COFCA|nr:unnamed protein product [Coffea canephora]